VQNEADFTYRLTRELRQRLPDAVIIKLSDKFTAGLPDFFISLHKSVTFFEVKLTSNREIFRPIQLETLLRLERGAYILWDSYHHLGWAFWAKDHKLNYEVVLTYQQLILRILQLESEEI
jgi:hypothetical protein